MIRKVRFSDRKKKRFMQTESVLQTKNRSGPAKNRFSVALVLTLRGHLCTHETFMSLHNSVLYLVKFIDQKGIILYETMVNE